MFRYSSRIIAHRPASFFSPLSGAVSMECPTMLLPTTLTGGQTMAFHTEGSMLLDGKKDAYKRRLMIASLLKKKQKEKAKKAKKSAASAGKKRAKGGIKQVTPQMKTTGKEGTAMPKDIVYDGTPRVKMEWNKKRGSLPYEDTTNEIFSSPKEKGQFFKFLQSKRGVDVKDIKFDAKGNPVLVPLFNIDGLQDLSGYVSNSYKLIENEAKRLNDILKKGDISDSNAGITFLKDLDALIQSTHELQSTLQTLSSYATKEKTRAELSKYLDEFTEVIPQIFSDNCDKFAQGLKQLETVFASSPAEAKALNNLTYWCKRYGAFIGKSGYNQFSTAYKAVAKHFGESEKRAENLVFVSIPSAYEHQLPKGIRAPVTKTRTKYLGLDSYKIGASSYVLPVLTYIRDPFVRRDVFGQGREAIEGEKNKYLPTLQQSSQFLNKLASSLGFSNVVSMEMTEKYNLPSSFVHSTLLNISKDAYTEQYIASLAKSKKKENAVWKYVDKEKDTIPDYDKLHAEYVHFEEVMGAFPEHQTKSFLPLYSILFSFFKQIESSFGVTIKGELAQPGELWDDETVKKFVIYENEKPISVLYLDIFPRSDKASDEPFKSFSIPRVARGKNDLPCVLVRGVTAERFIQPTLTHKQLSSLFRVLAEASYDAIVTPKQPYYSLSSDLDKKAFGAYFARLVHNKDYLSSIAAHFQNSKRAPQPYIEDMLLQDPIVRPIQFVEKSARALLDISIFSQEKPNVKSIFNELEAAVGKGKFQPDLSLGKSVQACGNEYVSHLADMMGAELFSKYPTSSPNEPISEDLKSQLLSASLKYDVDFDAIKAELKEAALADEKNDQQVAKYAKSAPPKTSTTDTFFSTQESL